MVSKNYKISRKGCCLFWYVRPVVLLLWIKRSTSTKDEHVSSLLILRIPCEKLGPILSSSDIPGPVLLTLLSHLQITLEASYISPTPNNAASNLILPVNRSKRAMSPLMPPQTPHPVPQTSTPDAQYARSDPGVVMQSYLWGEGKSRKSENPDDTLFNLFPIKAERAWVAVYKLDVSVGARSQSRRLALCA